MKSIRERDWKRNMERKWKRSNWWSMGGLLLCKWQLLKMFSNCWIRSSVIAFVIASGNVFWYMWLPFDFSYKPC